MGARPSFNHAGWLGVVVLAAPVFASEACAAEPVAIVEEVRGSDAHVQPLDYLAKGTVIRLSAQDRVVIDYLRSCKRETITGGVITVGATQSTLEGGKLKSKTVACDGRRRHLQQPPGERGGGPSFGALLKPEGQPRETGIEWTLYGQSPLVDLGGPGRLTIERLDQPGQNFDVDVDAAQLLRGRFYDFAKTDRALTPGGTYRASFKGRRIVFWVDALADSGPTALAGRLLVL